MQIQIGMISGFWMTYITAGSRAVWTATRQKSAVRHCPSTQTCVTYEEAVVVFGPNPPYYADHDWDCMWAWRQRSWGLGYSSLPKTLRFTIPADGSINDDSAKSYRLVHALVASYHPPTRSHRRRKPNKTSDVPYRHFRTRSGWCGGCTRAELQRAATRPTDLPATTTRPVVRPTVADVRPLPGCFRSRYVDQCRQTDGRARFLWNIGAAGRSAVSAKNSMTTSWPTFRLPFTATTSIALYLT